MQTLTKEGSRAVLAAVDADGLDTVVPDPTDWTVSGEFDVIVADDGLSGAVVPRGTTSTGTLVIKAGNLTYTEDVSFTASSTGGPKEATKLNVTWTPIAPAPAPSPAPAP